jgi:uroporphyrinogen decarboxylase
MTEKKSNKFTFIETLAGNKTKDIPFWFMRQAGRYLPEYRALREQAGGFLKLAYNPDWASEVTIQPIRRNRMHAAILFSDILVIPHALGMDLKFETGEGPRLNALENLADIENLNLENINKTLSPIYQTVEQTRTKLAQENFDDTALIGFAGSPWTVACYMIDGRGKTNFPKARQWALQQPDLYQKLSDILVTATSEYLIAQIRSGAQAVQLFDSWAGLLANDEFTVEDFDRLVIKPTAQIVKNIHDVYPNIPVIGFPREAGDMAIDYAKNTGIQAIGLDYSMTSEWARNNLQNILPIQGNLDPQILLEGGEKMEVATKHILRTLAEKPFIFNLGHGVIKETPPEHVEQLCQIIRDFKS